MMQLTKQQQPYFLELKEIQKQMRQAAEQAKMYENSIMILQRTVKKNQLTVKQLEGIPQERGIYVPLGRAFLKRTKPQTIKQMSQANKKLQESTVQMEKNLKFYAEKTDEKKKILQQGSERLMKMLKKQ